MTRKGFSKISSSGEKLFGPRGMIAYGFSMPDQKAIMNHINSLDLPDIPTSFAGDESLAENLLTLLQAKQTKISQQRHASLGKVIILSGLTEEEVHLLLNTWPKTSLPSPLWAVLTPTSQHWTLCSLIKALEGEARVMAQKQRN